MRPRHRAAAAGLDDVGSLEALVALADVVVSVCPPAAAIDVAAAVAAAGFAGTYVDVNAVAPATARAIGARFEHFVDGGVIGPPLSKAGATRLYLRARPQPASPRCGRDRRWRPAWSTAGPVPRRR